MVKFKCLHFPTKDQYVNGRLGEMGEEEIKMTRRNSSLPTAAIHSPKPCSIAKGDLRTGPSCWGSPAKTSCPPLGLALGSIMARIPTDKKESTNCLLSLLPWQGCGLLSLACLLACSQNIRLHTAQYSQNRRPAVHNRKGSLGKSQVEANQICKQNKLKVV